MIYKCEIHEYNDGFEVSGFGWHGGDRTLRSGFFNKSEGWTRELVETAVRHLLTHTNPSVR